MSTAEMTREQMEQMGDELARYELKEQAEEINAMIRKYGRDELARRILAYAAHIERISDCNRNLSNPATELDDKAYNDAVSHIMEATQEYYRYLGSLPEDLRKFFLTIYEATGDGSGSGDTETDLISALFGVETPLPRTPSMQAIRPKKYIMQIDAISNQLPVLADSNQLKVGARGNQPIKTAVTLDIPEHMKIEGGMVLSTYDKSIINGVTSLLECGNAVFSIPMLYHAMTGKPNPTVDDQLFEELGGRLEKMRRMMLSIDLTEESRASFISDENGDPLDIQNLTIEGYLLPLNKLSGVINGKKTELFQLLDSPPLYTYSKLKHQLASVPISLLSAPVNNNSTTIPLKTYLLQRIELMKNKNNNIRANNILYESIYAELGDADANKTRKMRIRGYTTTILDYFIEKGYITRYSEYKSGRSIAGVTIQL